MTTTISPYHNNLIVEPFALGEISRGGLLIPQVAKASTPYRYGKVLAVGPGRYAGDGRLIPCSSQVGSIIAYAKNQGVPFPLDDENGVERELLLLNEQFVMGSVEGLPEQSTLTGLDGRLLTMAPGSHARSDLTYQNLETITRARADGIIDSVGGTLDRMEALDAADADAEGD
jgi:co-chaperonin GroES (HSP10)